MYTSGSRLFIQKRVDVMKIEMQKQALYLSKRLIEEWYIK